MVGGGGRCYRSECAILSWPTGMRQPLVENDGDAQVIEIQFKINGAVDVTCCMTTATPHWRSRFGLGFSRIGTSAARAAKPHSPAFRSTQVALSSTQAHLHAVHAVYAVIRCNTMHRAIPELLNPFAVVSIKQEVCIATVPMAKTRRSMSGPLDMDLL